MASKDMSILTFEPLHPTIGAECFGVDFSKPLTEKTVAEIRTGMAKFGVLVFRATGLDDARHEAFARNFGEPDTSTVNPTAGKEHRLAPHMELTDAGNVDREGNLASKDSLRYQVNLGNGQFHVDCSYNARRAGYSILRAHQLPPSGTCGGTAFADTRTAYHDLDSGTKQDIKNVILWHSILHSRQKAAPDCGLINMLYAEDLPMSRHKLAQLHEPSGRMNLYIASHAHSIQGKSKAESQPLIQRLLAHASQERYVLRVNWQNAGDVVMWVSGSEFCLCLFSFTFLTNSKDNTCVMHKACGGSFQGRYIRDMRRATIYDSSSTAYGLNTFWSRTREGMRVIATAIVFGKVRMVKFFWELWHTEL